MFQFSTLRVVILRHSTLYSKLSFTDFTLIFIMVHWALLNTESLVVLSKTVFIGIKKLIKNQKLLNYYIKLRKSSKILKMSTRQ